MSFTFVLTVIAWIFFRADTVRDALGIMERIITSFHKVSLYELRSLANSLWLTTAHVVLVVFLIVVEWLQRDKQHALELDNVRIPRLVRWAYYYFIIFLIFYFSGSQQDFIYFQF